MKCWSVLQNLVSYMLLLVLPKFLFKEGSLALMNMASLMFLVVPCESLWNMLKQSGPIGCPVELIHWWMGDRAMRCSLSLSPNALPISPIYYSGQLICRQLYLYMTPLFCSLVSLSMGAISKVLIVFEPLKCTFILFLLHVLLNFPPIPIYMEPLWKHSCCSCYCWSNCCCGC